MTFNLICKQKRNKLEIIMKTFYGDDGNYEDIPLEDILDRMTDDWIDDNITGENISELRDACRKLLEIAHNSDMINALTKTIINADEEVTL